MYKPRVTYFNRPGPGDPARAAPRGGRGVRWIRRIGLPAFGLEPGGGTAPAFHEAATARDACGRTEMGLPS
jgi:hypothetical protein